MVLGSVNVKVLGRIVACIVYVAVLSHLVNTFGLPTLSTPRRIFTAIISTPRWIFTAIKDGVTHAVACRRCRKRATLGVLDTVVRNRMDDFKLQQCHAVINRASQFSAVIVIFGTVLGELNGELYEPEYVNNLFRALLLYVLLLLVVCGCVQLTIRKLHIIIAIPFCIMLSSLFQMKDEPTFFFFIGFRVVVRIFFGLMYLDYKKSCGWNVLLSCATCWCYQYNDSTIQPPFSEQWSWAAFNMLEVWTCAFVVVGLYAVEKWLESRVRLQFVAENQTRASLRLLGFQCDAVLWLTPELHIDGPATELTHFLLLEGTFDHMAGREFERYVADDSDRQRFRDFIASSSANHGADPPPAVLHMNMRDATNTNISVDVYHVHSIDLQDQERHLIGIRENAAREAQQESDQQQEPAGQVQPNRQVDQEPQQGHEPQPQGQHQQGDQTHLQHQRQRDETTGPTLPSVPEDRSPPALPAAAEQPNRTAAPSESSSFSSSIEEILFNGSSEMFVTMDVFSRSLPISECHLVFGSTRRTPAPEFASMLEASSLKNLRRWMQGHVQAAITGNVPEHLDRDGGRLVLQPADGPQIFVESTRVICPRSLREGESEQAVLRLRGLSLLAPRAELDQEHVQEPQQEQDAGLQATSL